MISPDLIINMGGGFGGGGGAPYQATPLGFGTLTVTGTAALLSTITVGGVEGVPADATFAWVIVESADVRWRDDGAAPTPGAGGGMPLLAGQGWLFSGDLASLQFIAQESTNAVLSVSFGA